LWHRPLGLCCQECWPNSGFAMRSSLKFKPDLAEACAKVPSHLSGHPRVHSGADPRAHTRGAAAQAGGQGQPEPLPDSLDVSGHGGYSVWRDRKLGWYPADSRSLVVKLRNPEAPDCAERAALAERLQRFNMAVYHCEGSAPDPLRCIQGLERAFGLEPLAATGNGGMKAGAKPHIQVIEAHPGPGGCPDRYIPFTDKALGWHTDGYYYRAAKRVRAFVMHCERPAAAGGSNRLLDPEVLYLHLRDRDPELASASGHALHRPQPTGSVATLP